MKRNFEIVDLYLCFQVLIIVAYFRHNWIIIINQFIEVIYSETKNGSDALQKTKTAAWLSLKRIKVAGNLSFQPFSILLRTADFSSDEIKTFHVNKVSNLEWSVFFLILDFRTFLRCKPHFDFVVFKSIYIDTTNVQLIVFRTQLKQVPPRDKSWYQLYRDSSKPRTKQISHM